MFLNSLSTNLIEQFENSCKFQELFLNFSRVKLYFAGGHEVKVAKCKAKTKWICATGLALILPLHQSGENKDKIFSIQSSDVCG